MRLAKARLNSKGVLSFSVEGYESYLSEPARLRVSSLNNTARSVFAHTLILPGRKIYFIASDAPLSSDIPGLLIREGIKTDYIANYFAGDVSQGRIEALMRLMDPRVPVNTDFRPFLMRLAYEHWFAKYSSYPFGFFAVLGAFFILYITRLRLEEFVLFTTGCINMGSEILTIFLFQILFGFLYVKIGLIVTVYLAGLIPGVILGQRLKTGMRSCLFHTDCLMALLLLILLSLLFLSPQGLSEAFFYAFAFLISMLCGVQFPLVAGASGGGNTVSARAFSVDLVGAALGNVLLSALLIPFFGIIASCAALIVFKLASIIIQISHGKAHQEDILTF
jgi:spermidine synthase